MERSEDKAGRDRALPASDLDLTDAQVVTDLFDQAAEANLHSKHRQGATAHMPPEGRLWMSGDLHDNAPNLLRLLKLAKLDNSANHHLVLHELIHGPHHVNGADLSVRMLARAAALKLAHPTQVYILQANHELAQLQGQEISKGGVSVVGAFDAGVDFIYGHDAKRIRQAMDRFIRSFLLAVRCPNGILCSHSLPSPRQLPRFDPEVLNRVPTEEDLQSGGSAHMLVWGRNHTQDLADALCERWGVQCFVMGHQPAEMGYETEGRSMLVLASDHDHGLALPIDLSRHYDLDDLVAQLVPLASVVV